MARVELKGVVKRFGKVVAVNHVSLDIGDKEFFSLLGPSGCGKTTVLRIIAGLEFPDEGDVLIDGKVVTHLPPKDRDVAMVFQNYALYPHMSVFDNIAFPLNVRRRELKLTKEDIRKRVIEVAKLLNIEELLRRYPSQLSGGEQQRVALARALVRRPKVWLLDEPLSNLDAKLRVAMRSELKKLQKTLGITTVYVTHDQVEAMGMADRIAVMNKGRVLQVGTPDELYYKPSDTFVATFIGSPPMNIVPCTLEEQSTSYTYKVPVEHSGGIIGEGTVTSRLKLKCADVVEIPLAPRYAELLSKSGRDFLLGIRPEYIELTKTKPDLEIGVVKSKVEVTEPLGSEIITTVQLGSELIKVKTHPDVKISPGDEVYLKLDLRRALVFDKKTGKLVV
jgi:multiple sugar transport system ATP-binding protein